MCRFGEEIVCSYFHRSSLSFLVSYTRAFRTARPDKQRIVPRDGSQSQTLHGTGGGLVAPEKPLKLPPMGRENRPASLMEHLGMDLSSL